VKITTETGSVYDIDDHGICRKYNKSGELIDSFKAFHKCAVPAWVTTTDELYALPKSEPEVGKRLYISGMNDSWISTKVISIE
jgi:hypothetical protein